MKRNGNVGFTYEEQGRHAEAETLRRELLEIARRTLGEEHPNCQMLRALLASGAALQGRRDDAIQFLREALDNGYENRFGFVSADQFPSLRGDAEFEAIVEELRRRSQEAEATAPGE